MQKTGIDWATHTWNPVVGCNGPDGTPRFLPERLDGPLKVKRASRVFAGSMTDLFGKNVKREWIDDILRVTFKASHHTYIMLTKQAKRMCEVMTGVAETWAPNDWALTRNLWFGVSITNQQDAEDRLPWLRKTPAAVRLVSVEPMQDYVYLGQHLDMLDWVIIGAETGNRSGKVIPERGWIEALVAQCRAASVAVFEKGSLAGIVDRPLIQEYPQARMEAEND